MEIMHLYEVNYRARVWIHNMYAYVCKRTLQANIRENTNILSIRNFTCTLSIINFFFD